MSNILSNYYYYQILKYLCASDDITIYSLIDIFKKVLKWLLNK